MKVGEIIVKPPQQPGDMWIAHAGAPSGWPSESLDEGPDGQPVIRGIGSDAALAIKDLWKNIGRAYLGAEARQTRGEPVAEPLAAKMIAWLRAHGNVALEALAPGPYGERIRPTSHGPAWVGLSDLLDKLK